MAEADKTKNVEQPPGIPRWVKVSGLVVLIVILMLVVVGLVFGVEHGPGQHGPSTENGLQILWL